MSPWRIAARIFAVLLVALYVAMMPALLLTYDVQVVVMDGRFLETATADSRIYEQILIGTAESLARNTQEPGADRAPLAGLDAAEWERALWVMAPPDALQRWLQDATAQLRRWLQEGGDFTEDVTLPFAEMRANIVDDPQHTFLQLVLDQKAECRANQEALSGANDLIPDCRPANNDARGTLVGLLAERWRAQPREAWQQLFPGELGEHPDNESLADWAVAVGSSDLDELRAGMAGMHVILAMSRWLTLGTALALSLVLIGLVALLAARNAAEAVRWAGAPLAFAGVATLLAAVPVRALQAVGTFAFDPADTLTRVQGDVIAAAFARPFMGELWPLLAMHGGILLAIGVTLWLGSWFIPVRRPEAAAVPAPAAPPEILR